MEYCCCPIGDERCSNLSLENKNFCDIHYDNCMKLYFRHKRYEDKIRNIIDDDINYDDNVDLLLKKFHKLSTAYKLRSEYREKCFCNETQDKGHTIFLNKLYQYSSLERRI